MREWIDLIEESQFSGLWWFWYNPSEDRLEHIDGGDHASYAHYHLGFGDAYEMGDSDCLKAAIDAGWVRGRYGEQKSDGSWDSSFEWDGQDWTHNGGAAELNLQGKPRDVLKTARFIASKYPVSSLYVDFASTGNVHDDMTDRAAHLTGDRLAFYLKKGSIPSSMVRESLEDFGSTPTLFHGLNTDSLWIVMKEGHLTVGAQGRDYAGPNGICMSRSFEVASGFAHSWSEHLFDSFYAYFALGEPPKNLSGAVLEFDRTRLAQRHEIIPYDDFGDFTTDGEEEERVLGNVALDDALVAIYVDPEEIRQFLKDATQAFKNGGREYDEEFVATISRVLKDPRLKPRGT